MGFKKFKIIDDVVNHFQLSFQKENFLFDTKQEKMPEFLKSELDYVMKNIPYKVSEAAIRENILYPILKEVFKKYDDKLMLWANKSISFSKELSGMPDYILAKQSERGKIIFGKPLLAVVEAKKDDFEGGWAQCLLEMYTIQKINGKPEIPVLGIVSNGDNWEFGKLEGNLFTENALIYSLFPLDTLFSTLSTFFELCKENAEKL
ncbi:hypothetical protein [Emticicia sp. W12TSBA100-4]|uniref:hypothetical protein n=1 Tax=Emticicia sp. W12TSBA100-4 TaxID=3160965 RepID=UPI0033060647